MGRPARGVRGMDLAEGDFIVGAEVIGEEGLILSISEHGYGKRTQARRITGSPTAAARASST